MEAEVVKRSAFDTPQFGPNAYNVMNKLIDADGNKFVIFSKAKALQVEEGTVVKFTSTVKAHEISKYEPDNNNKVTILSRVGKA